MVFACDGMKPMLLDLDDCCFKTFIFSLQHGLLHFVQTHTTEGMKEVNVPVECNTIGKLKKKQIEKVHLEEKSTTVSRLTSKAHL